MFPSVTRRYMQLSLTWLTAFYAVQTCCFIYIFVKPVVGINTCGTNNMPMCSSLRASESDQEDREITQLRRMFQRITARLCG
jgi:hypothetical protein